MKRATYSQFGTPEEVLRVEEAERPVPGPGQVLVRMILSPVHNHDIMTIAGQYGIRPALPSVPGTEAVGIVEALGEGVANLAVGQRVAGGAEQSWAEYYLANAARLVPVPQSVSDETACQLVSMPLSAKMLLDWLDVHPGEWIALNAANGAIGKLVARYGAEKGINVLGLVRRAAAVEPLRAEGFANVVSTDAENWQDAVRTITGGAPIVRVIDSVSGSGANDLLAIAGQNAQFISFGAMERAPLRISPGDLMFRNITVRGFWGARPPVAPERIGQLLGELVMDAASGRLVLPIEAEYGLDDVAEAVRASGEPGRRGKIAIRGN